MIIMSLRGAFAATKQSPNKQAGCFAKSTHNDIWAMVNALPAHAFGRIRSPPLCYGDGPQSASGEELSAVMPSVLDKAFDVEL